MKKRLNGRRQCGTISQEAPARRGQAVPRLRGRGKATIYIREFKQMGKISLFIDGTEIQAEEGMRVLEDSLAAGI